MDELLRSARTVYRGTLTNSLATLFTSRSNGTVKVLDIVVCNNDSVSRNVTLKLGGKFFYGALPVAAGNSVAWTGVQCVENGGLIEGFASAAAVVDVHITGTEVG